MRLLAFDTSTDRMTVAVTGPAPGQPWQRASAGGAAASASLIATVRALLDQANLRLQDLDAICFGSGPGSFTGLRTACAVAQGLALGADLLVLPVPSLLSLAQAARAVHAPGESCVRVTALLDARMDEVYAASYLWQGDRLWCVHAPCLLAPEQVAAWAAQPLAPDLPLPTWHAWAGNVAQAYGPRLAPPPGTPCLQAWPQAQAMLQLAPVLMAQGLAVPPERALPLYVRDKVAKTTEERALEKAGKAQAAAGLHGHA